MDSNSPDGPPDAAAPAATPPGQARFTTCRWQRAAENDLPACCGHRDVLPMAGTTSFNPESWCVDCDYYKVKRAPRPRTEASNYPRWND